VEMRARDPVGIAHPPGIAEFGFAAGGAARFVACTNAPELHATSLSDRELGVSFQGT